MGREGGTGGREGRDTREREKPVSDTWVREGREGRVHSSSVPFGDTWLLNSCSN